MTDQESTRSFDFRKYMFGLYISIKEGEFSNYRKFFTEYINKAAKDVKQGQENLQEKYSQFKEKYPDDYFEHMDIFEDESEKHFSFNPALFNHSIFLYIFSYYETSIVQLSKELEMFFEQERPILKKTNTVEKYISYIFSILVADDLQPLRSKLAPYQRIRNKLIHNFGYLDHSDNNTLKQIGKIHGIKINENNMSFFIQDSAFNHTFMDSTFQFLEALRIKAELLKDSR